MSAPTRRGPQDLSLVPVYVAGGAVVALGVLGVSVAAVRSRQGKPASPPLRAALLTAVLLGAAGVTRKGFPRAPGFVPGARWRPPGVDQLGPVDPGPTPKRPQLKEGEVWVLKPTLPEETPPDLTPALFGSGDEWFYFDGWTQHGDTGRWRRRHSEGPRLMSPYDAGARHGVIFSEVAWQPPPGAGGRHLVRRFQWDRDRGAWNAPVS